MAENSLPKFKVLYAPARFPDDTLWFADRLDDQFLDDQAAILTAYEFSCNYMMSPIDKKTRVFRDEWWKTYEELPRKYENYLIIDPAGEHKSKINSWTALVHIAVPESGFPWYIRDAERWTATDQDFLDNIFKLDGIYKFTKIGIEMLQLRALLESTLATESVRRNHFLLDRIVSLETKGVPKLKRIQGLTGPWATGQVLCPKDGMRDLKDEFSRFPSGKTYDLLDAVAYLPQLLDAPYIVEDEESRESRKWDRYREFKTRAKTTTKGYTTGYY